MPYTLPQLTFFHLTAHLGHHSPHSLGRWIEKVAFCQAWGWGGVAVQPITSASCVQDREGAMHLGVMSKAEEVNKNARKGGRGWGMQVLVSCKKKFAIYSNSSSHWMCLHQSDLI